MTQQDSNPKSNKKKPQNLAIPPPKPKLSKAERRALQEQQRAAKAAGAASGHNKPPAAPPQAAPPKAAPPKAASPLADTSSKQVTDKPPAAFNKNKNTTTNAWSLVSHLAPYQAPRSPVGASLGKDEELPLAVLQLGRQYASLAVKGGNARCRALLQCFQHVLMDYPHPASTLAVGRNDLRSAVDLYLKSIFQYLTKCRQHSVSMGNAFTFLKTAVANLDREIGLEQLQTNLIQTLQAYEQERIDFATKAIADTATSLLKQHEVILTYGRSEAILAVLKASQNCKVIVVDSKPFLEGRQLLRELRASDVACSYILLNAVSYVMPDVTKVLLGASALMSDGSVLGRVGTAPLAMAAQAAHKPVLVCAETYKISNRVQLESITHNELGNPATLLSSTSSAEPVPQNLKLLNLLYDLTPASFVTGIVTELGIVPPTSVAVLLREMNPHDFSKST